MCDDPELNTAGPAVQGLWRGQDHRQGLPERSVLRAGKTMCRVVDPSE